MSNYKSTAASVAAMSGVLLLLGAFGWIKIDREGSNSDPYETLDNHHHSSSQSHVTVCLDLGDGAYDTRHLTPLDAYSFLASGDLAMSINEPCHCGPLCFPHSFHQLGNRCLCNKESDATTDSILPSRRHRHLVHQEPRRSLLFLDDENDLSICTRSFDKCSTEKRCPSNQICIAPKKPLNGTTNQIVVPCGCQPIKCANPYGNPCGPDAACSDTATGYTCATILTTGCRLDCGPNEFCNRTIPVPNNPSVPLFECRCKPGFIRLAPHLPCECPTISCL